MNYIKDLETDVQNIFITSIVFSNNFLIISDEQKRVYKLDLKNLEVSEAK